MGVSELWRPWQSDPWLPKLALASWYVTFIVGKEPKLVQEVGRY